MVLGLMLEQFRESFSFLEGGFVVVFASLVVADLSTSDKPSSNRIQVGHDEIIGDGRLPCLIL
jgi:hypothetical protein